jgi:cobalamin biosynthesis protein CbiG
VGGANGLAHRVAGFLGAQAVITTATDVNHVFAVDAWATGQGLVVLDRQEAKLVSATLLDGGSVGLVSDVPIAGPVPSGVVVGEGAAACSVGIFVSARDAHAPFEHTLRLVPRVLTVGVGCKRGTEEGLIGELVDACLARSGYVPESVRLLATIDLKADEVGLVRLARKRGWEVRLSSADELVRVRGQFASSDFVLRTVGVDNVCERAACAGGERLLMPRTSSRGVTVALGVGDVSLAFDEPAMEGEDLP